MRRSNIHQIEKENREWRKRIFEDVMSESFIELV